MKHDEKKIEELYGDFDSLRIMLRSYIPNDKHLEEASFELLELYKSSKQYAEHMVQQERERSAGIVEEMMEDEENWQPIVRRIKAINQEPVCSGWDCARGKTCPKCDYKEINQE